MGSDSRIQTKQPFTNVDIDEWEPGKDFMFAYRPNYKGEETSNKKVSSDGLGRKRDITTSTTDMYGNNLYNRMKDASLRLLASEDAKIQKISTLSYLTIPYYDFNGKVQTGEMVVAKELADEVLKIFQELYNIKFPIERMNLVDNYTDKLDSSRKADDWTSIQANNTSAFNYRYANDGLHDRADWGFSGHGEGNAIDINPLINPFIKGYDTTSDIKKLYTTHWPEDGPDGARHYDYEHHTEEECLNHVNHNDKFLDRTGMNGWTDVEKRAKSDIGTELNTIFSNYGWKMNDDGNDIDIQHYSKIAGTSIYTIPNWDEILKNDEKEQKKSETTSTNQRVASSTSNRALSTTKTQATTTGKEIEIPSGLGSVFTYEPWQEMPTWSDVNYKNAPQGKLVAQAVDKSDETTNFDEEGFGKINGRYVIACTTTFGVVGDYIDFYQSDGTVFHCIIGDIKSFNDAGCTEWGHKNGNNVVEFLVNGKNYGGNPPAWSAGRDSNGNVIDTHTNPGESFGNTGPCHPEWGGKTMTKAVNLRKLF